MYMTNFDQIRSLVHYHMHDYNGDARKSLEAPFIGKCEVESKFHKIPVSQALDHFSWLLLLFLRNGRETEGITLKRG